MIRNNKLTYCGVLGVITACTCASVLLYLKSQILKWPEPIEGNNLELIPALLEPSEMKQDNAFYYLNQLSGAGWDDITDEQDRALRKFINGKEFKVSPILDRLELKYKNEIDLILKAGNCSYGIAATQITNRNVNQPAGFFNLEAYSQIVLYSIFKGLNEQPQDTYSKFTHYIQATIFVSHYTDIWMPQVYTYPILKTLAENKIMDRDVRINISKMILRLYSKKGTVANHIRLNRMMTHKIIASNTTKKKKLLQASEAAELNQATTMSKQHLDAVYQHLIRIADALPSQKSFDDAVSIALFTYSLKIKISDIRKYPILHKAVYSLYTEDLLSVPIIIAGLGAGHGAGHGAVQQEMKLNHQFIGLAVNLAVSAYKDDNGYLPDSLGKTIPKYLDKVPTDPVTENKHNLKYTKFSKKLWTLSSQKYTAKFFDSRKQKVVTSTEQLVFNSKE